MAIGMPTNIINVDVWLIVYNAPLCQKLILLKLFVFFFFFIEILTFCDFEKLNFNEVPSRASSFGEKKSLGLS
jgi:hypothetical protein